MASSFLLNLNTISQERIFRLFMILIILQMILSIANASIVVKDNRETDQDKYRYGIITIIFSIIWILLAIIAGTWSMWFMKYVY